MKVDIIYDISNWAAIYFMYDDPEGLTVEDKKQADDFLALLKKQGVVRLIEPADCSEQVFNRWPAFGKPCDTQDWIAEVQ